MRYTIPAVLVSLLCGCAGLGAPEPGSSAAYCSPQNAFRLGSQSRAYYGTCPKESETAFLAALERGRALVQPPPQALPYYEEMGKLEKQIIATPSEAEREKLRERLRLAEWWAIHLLNAPGSYSVDT